MHMAFSFQRGNMQEKKKQYWIYGVGILLLILGLMIGVYSYQKSQLPDKINILCLGIDKMVPLEERDPLTNSIGQADAIYVVSVSRSTGEINVVAIPRDTMVYVERYTSNMEYMGTEALQICTQYAYGDGTVNSCQLTQKRVEEVLPEVRIDGYVAININAIMDLNDAIGGVEVVIEDDYTAFQMSKWKGSTVNLMGIDTMNYLRVRDCTVEQSAYYRNERIKNYIAGFIPKAKETIMKEPEVLGDIYQSLKENMVMNLSFGQLWDLANIGLKGSFDQITTHTLTGEIYISEEGYEEFYPYDISIEEMQKLLK